MSLKRLQAVWERSRLKGSARLCLLAIADRAKDDGFAWPGLNDVARRANVGKRVASRAIRRAEAAGELYVHERPGTTNQYVVVVGQSWEETVTALMGRFGLSTDEIADWLESRGDKNGGTTKMTGGTDMTEVRDESYRGGDDKNGRGGGTKITPEPSFNPKINNPNENEERSLLKREGEALWERCLETLRQDSMMTPRFVNMLSEARPRGVEAGVLVVQAPDADRRDWLAARAAKTLERMLIGLRPGEELRVRFVVGEGEEENGG